MRAFRAAAAACVWAFACSGETTRYPPAASPGARGAAAPGASAGTPGAMAAGSGACTATDCASCVGAGCHWCTEPARCGAATAACGGLSLSDPSHCGVVSMPSSDPAVEAARGKNAVGAPIEARLETFPGIEFSIDRGRCYTIIVKLGAGAKPGDGFISSRMTTRAESTGGSGGWMRSDTPPLTIGPYCPLGPGKLRFGFVDRFRMTPIAANGTGPISFQLFTEPVSEDELRGREAANARLMERIERMPADCDDCGFNCESAQRACERRCFVDFNGNRSGQASCEYGCEQIERSCASQCEARCR